MTVTNLDVVSRWPELLVLRFLQCLDLENPSHIWNGGLRGEGPEINHERAVAGLFQVADGAILEHFPNIRAERGPEITF